MQCWEQLRALDVDGYRTSKAAPPSTWLVEIEWGDRHTRRSIGRGTTCSPFVTQAVAMALSEGDSEPFRPRLADGTKLPFLFSQLANGVLKSGVPAYERALAAWDATLADNEWPRPVIFFNLGYAVEPTELRRGDCVHIDWMSGGGHAVFCWDVHLNEHGEVDAFQYLSANGRMANGGSGGGIAVGGTTDGTGGFIRRTDTPPGDRGDKGDAAPVPQYAAADPPLFRDDERYVVEGRWVTWDPEVASRPLSGLRRKARKRPLLVKRVKAARFHGIDVSTIPLFAMGQDAPGPLVRPAPAATPAPAPTLASEPPGHEEIALVQSQLRLLFRLGWIDQDPGRADGKLGPRTTAAVVAFQTAYGLPAAGELNELVRERLRSVCESARDAPSARQPQPQPPQPPSGDGAPVAFSDEQPEPGPVQLYFRQGAARPGESVEVIARGTPLDIGRAALLLVEDGLSEAAAGPAAASIELYGERAAASVVIPERPPGTRLVARIAGTDIVTEAPLTVAAHAAEAISQPRTLGEPEASIDPRLQRLEAAIAEVLLGTRPLVAIASEAGVERDELLRWAVRYSDGGRQALGQALGQGPGHITAQPAPATEPAVAVPPPASSTARSFAASDESAPISRTLIISDLHLGNGGPYDIYAGGPELVRFLDSEATRQPTRVICNGDTVDFLLNTEPLTLSSERALACARALASHPETAAIFAAFGRVLQAGGEVVIRLGNHDAELGLREVQEVFRAALAQPPAIASRLIWQRGDDPVRSGGVLEVGGARVLVTHGEQNDPWNHLDYPHLPPGASDAAALQAFEYPPGSRLVKTLLNPLKARYQMRFADLLKPDFQGAVLTALAVNPAAVRTVFQGDTAVLLWQLFRRRGRRGMTFAQPEGDSADLGLSERVQQAGLSTAEEQAIIDAVTASTGAAPGGGRSFAAPDSDESSETVEGEAVVREGALAKLARIGLTTYAAAHRRLAGRLGESYFDLAPDAEELGESRRLAQKFGVDAVIFGHTHAARFHESRDLVYVNTGTWIWLMQLPPADADLDTWRRFLESLRRDPPLSTPASAGSGVELMRRLHVARLEPHPDGGARVALFEWLPGRGLAVVRETQVRPRGKGA
jgi:UDP-2,3-diacylglucosamine pyrophosphatase LpxH/peptidoglycan hydrolase-like protein with peptidoglycan-binding domain